jgi:hypothetical protein
MKRAFLKTFSAFLLGGALLAGCGAIDAPPASRLTTSTTPATTSSETPTPTSTSTTAPASTEAPAPVAATSTQVAAPATTKAAAPVTTKAAAKSATTSCTGDYYRNVDGNCIHRPAAADSAPAGATARCNDGTYSFSAHRRGTCSSHQGVATWL